MDFCGVHRALKSVYPVICFPFDDHNVARLETKHLPQTIPQKLSYSSQPTGKQTRLVTHEERTCPKDDSTSWQLVTKSNT